MPSKGFEPQSNNGFYSNAVESWPTHKHTLEPTTYFMQGQWKTKITNHDIKNQCKSNNKMKNKLEQKQ